LQHGASIEPSISLSYHSVFPFYQGLDLIQFKQAFEQLLKADEPTIECEKWVTADLLESRLHDFMRASLARLSRHSNAFGLFTCGIRSD